MIEQEHASITWKEKLTEAEAGVRARTETNFRERKHTHNKSSYLNRHKEQRLARRASQIQGV